jgi:transcriptional regulator with XRE-family HTH domain
MKERILEFLRAENKSSAGFAEEIGVQPSSISHILSGRNNPSLDFVIKMLKRYQAVSTDWLLFGKGQMFTDASQLDLFANEKNNDSKRIGQQLEIELDNIHKQQNQELAPDSGNIKDSIQRNNKETERIVFFYQDNTFREFYP